MRNKLRNETAINFIPIATWVVLGIFVAAGGLVFVDFKHQAHRRAEKITELKKTLQELQLANQAMQVTNDISPNARRKQRMEKGWLSEYVPIGDRLVVVSDAPRPESQLRPVSTERRE
jgi:hypothetical protein